MPPDPTKSCSTTPDGTPRNRTVSSRVNVSLLLELRKRKWTTWEEMLECPVVDWIEPFSNGGVKNGDNNGSSCKDKIESLANGDHEIEDELFHKEMEVEECRTDDTRVMTKLRRGVLDIGPTMSRLRSSTFSSCCLDRLVVMHCSCGEVVKREAYGTHHRMKHTNRSSAPGSPTTSHGSVPPSPLTLQPAPPSKLARVSKTPPPRLTQKKSSPKVVAPPKIHSTINNNEEKKPRATPPSQVGTQDWKVLSSTDGGGTKLRIVRVNPGQSSTTPPSAPSAPVKAAHESSEKTIEASHPMMQPLHPVSTVTPSPTGSEERLISPRDRRAAHREEIRQTRPTIRARHRLATPPVPAVAREEETRTSLPSRVHHPPTVYQSIPTTSYSSQPLHRPSEHPPSSLHPHSQSPLLISTSQAGMGGGRYTLHSPASSQMGAIHPPSQQRPSPTLAYTNEHGHKVYLMPRGTTQIKRPMSMQQQQMQQGEGMGYGGGGGPQGNPPPSQRQTIVIVLPPGARNRNGPIVLPPGTTLRAIPSGQSSSHHHGSSQLQTGIGPNGQPVHYISHTPLPPSTRRLDMPGGSSMYPHHRVVATQPHPSTSGSHNTHSSHPSTSSSHSSHPHHTQSHSYPVHQHQQQHHTISSSTIPSYQYQMVHQGDGFHSGNHSDQMGQRVVMTGQPIYGVQRVMNPGMQRVIEQRRIVHTPSPPPTLQPMPVLRAQLFDEGTQMRAKKSVSPSMVSSSTVDSPSQQPSSSTGFKEERAVAKSALMDILNNDDSSGDGISHEEVVSTGDGEEDEDEMMPVLECHSTFNEESEQVGREEEEMPEALEGCDSSTAFSTIPSSSTM